MAADKSASVYLRAGTLYIASSSRTEAGFWIQTPPFVAILADADREEVGRRLREALDASQPRVRTPSREEFDAQKPSEDPILRLAGMKGYGTFARGARHVVVSEEPGRVRLAPSRTDEKGHFDHLPDRSVIVENPSSGELADALREALRRCETFGER